MSDMKCPFCGEKLVKWMGYADCRFWTCNNVLCEAGRFGHIADECIWQELIRTRKALDIAKEGLKEIQDKGEYVNPIELAESYLDEITALEQKDK